MSQLKQTLNSDTGRELREYLLRELNKLQHIDSIDEKDTAEEQAIEVKAQKRAYIKVKEIYDKIMDLSKEDKEPDPRDSYDVT